MVAKKKEESQTKDVLLLQPSNTSIYKRYVKALSAQDAVFKALKKLQAAHNRVAEPVIKKIRKDGIKKIHKQREAIKRNTPVVNRGVLYISHIPYGFFDDQMQSYFSQFGRVVNCRHVRSQRTGRSRGYGYVEFREPEVAKVVADVMNDYLTFGRIIKCQVMDKIRVTNRLFKGEDINKHNCPGLTRRKTAILVLNGKRSGKKEVKRISNMAQKYESKLGRLNNRFGMELNPEKILRGEAPKPQVLAADKEMQSKIPPNAVKKTVWKASLASPKPGKKRTATSPEKQPKKQKLHNVENTPSTPVVSEMPKEKRSAKKKKLATRKKQKVVLEAPTKQMIIEKKKLAFKKKMRYTTKQIKLAQKMKLAKLKTTPSSPKKKEISNTENTPSTPSETPNLSAKKEKIAKIETTPSTPLASETPKLSAKKKKVANIENTPSETPKLSAKKKKFASIENTSTASEMPKSAKKKKVANTKNTPSTSTASETPKSVNKKQKVGKTDTTPKSPKKKTLSNIENTPKSAKKMKLANTPIASETPKSAKKNKLTNLQKKTPLALETPKSAKKKLSTIETTPPTTTKASATPRKVESIKSPENVRSRKKPTPMKSPKNKNTPKKPTPKKMK